MHREHREDKECGNSMLMQPSIMGEELKRENNSFLHESSKR